MGAEILRHGVEAGKAQHRGAHQPDAGEPLPAVLVREVGHCLVNTSPVRPRCRTPRRWRTSNPPRRESHQRGDLVDLDEPPARNLRQHVVDLLLGHLLEQRGAGGRGRHAVHRDVEVRKLLAERFRQRDHTGLGGRIGRRVRVSLLAGDRGDVDDAAVVLRDHQRDHRAAAIELAVEIDPHDLGPRGRVIFPGLGVRTGDAGVVDQDVDAAKRVLCRIARLFHFGKAGHVAGDRAHLAAVAQFACGLFRQHAIAVPDRHRAPRIQKPLDDRPADALRPAGHHRIPSAEIDPVGHCRQPSQAARHWRAAFAHRPA